MIAVAIRRVGKYFESRAMGKFRNNVTRVFHYLIWRRNLSNKIGKVTGQIYIYIYVIRGQKGVIDRDFEP